MSLLTIISRHARQLCCCLYHHITSFSFVPCTSLLAPPLISILASLVILDTGNFSSISSIYSKGFSSRELNPLEKCVEVKRVWCFIYKHPFLFAPLFSPQLWWLNIRSDQLLFFELEGEIMTKELCSEWPPKPFLVVVAGYREELEEAEVYLLVSCRGFT